MFRSNEAIDAPAIVTPAAARPQRRRGLGRLGRSLLVASFASLMAIGSTTANAAAATNNPGRVIAGRALCQDGWIQVKSPSISPAPLQYGSNLFGDPAQHVAWRANLDQLIGGRWVRIRDGIWFTGMANTSDVYGVNQNSWTMLNGQPMPYPIGFDSLPIGTKQAPAYFKIWYEFYWYSDAYRDAGSGWAWADGHQENRGSPYGTAVLDQTSYLYCKYPGPNWLL
jgi:hypothetical protein